jgi:hypothetical protein
MQCLHALIGFYFSLEYLSTPSTPCKFLQMAGKRKSYAEIAKKNSAKRAKQYAPRTQQTPKSFAAKVNQLILKQSEAKSSFSTGENMQLYHAMGYHTTVPNEIDGTQKLRATLTNLLGTNQGVGANARIGDKVHGKNVKIKLWLSNKGDRPNVMYRCIVYKTTFDNAGVEPSNFFTTGGNVMLGLINTDKYTVVSDRLIQPKDGDYSLESGSLPRERSQMVTINVPLNKAITYSVPGGGTPAGVNCYNLMIIPYDAWGSFPQDNLASMAYSSEFNFNDL